MLTVSDEVKHKHSRLNTTLVKLARAFSMLCTSAITLLLFGFSLNAQAVATTTTLTVNPTSAAAGANVTLTASVAGLTPTGNVVFKDGTTTIGTVATTGTAATRTAKLTTNFTTVGSHSITAAYAGDVDDAGSTSTAKTLTVTIKTTTTTLILSPTSAAAGANVILTASVAGFTPTGIVTFKDGTTVIGTAPLTGTGTTATTTLTTTFSTVASHSITAVYAGDANDKTSTSSAKAITVTKATTTTTLATSLTSPTIGQSVTLTTTVAGLTPTGTVTFKDGTSTIGTGTLTGTGANTTASLTTSFTATGAHSITVVYVGDTDDASSTSTATDIMVTAVNVAPTVSIVVPVNNTSYTAPADISIAANATDSDGTISKVDFYVDGALQGTSATAPYSILYHAASPANIALTVVATDNNGAVATSDPVNISISNGAAQVYYIHTDQLNTPRLITDSSNTTVWRWDDADPFANNVADQDPNNTGNSFIFNHRLPGQYYDKETGLSYNYFRDYDSEVGRYIQSDPIGLQGGINTYGYALENPLRYIDSTGLDVWLEGPSGGEPSFHQSVNVGDPNGAYNSYSFGMNGKGIQGEVYRDNDLGGPIEAYKKTSPQQDSAYQKWLDSQVGKAGTYGYDDICRSWSQRQYKRAPGVSAKPPIRVQVPQLNISPSSSRSTTGTSSTTGTGTSR